jgi:hypothetical protein
MKKKVAKAATEILAFSKREIRVRMHQSRLTHQKPSRKRRNKISIIPHSFSHQA